MNRINYPMNPTTDPRKPITTNSNNTLIGDIFFLAINHQANNTNTIVRTFGNAPSKLLCSNTGSPSEFVAICKGVVMLIQDAAIAPTITCPITITDSRNAVACSPTISSTAEPPSSYPLSYTNFWKKIEVTFQTTM